MYGSRGPGFGVHRCLATPEAIAVWPGYFVSGSSYEDLWITTKVARLCRHRRCGLRPFPRRTGHSQLRYPLRHDHSRPRHGWSVLCLQSVRSSRIRRVSDGEHRNHRRCHHRAHHLPGLGVNAALPWVAGLYPSIGAVVTLNNRKTTTSEYATLKCPLHHGEQRCPVGPWWTTITSGQRGLKPS